MGEPQRGPFGKNGTFHVGGVGVGGGGGMRWHAGKSGGDNDTSVVATKGDDALQANVVSTVRAKSGSWLGYGTTFQFCVGGRCVRLWALGHVLAP